MKKRISDDLSEIEFLSLSADLWSSTDFKHNLLGLTAHFVTHDFSIGWLVLGCIPIKETHKTGSVIAGKINDQLALLNIPKEKIHVLVRDAGSNMISATKILEISAVTCFAHVINLVAKTGEKEISMDSLLIENAKKLVRKINKSGINREYLKQLQNSLNIPATTLKKV
ncbi:unnamed protein product [Meloidogyne enterolobii]|uniref:Uncharacterized protein n=1 Tax=Meloidogyne enterolobii TaxID=390850 RepID=A0ACB0XNE7_MELEN